LLLDLENVLEYFVGIEGFRGGGRVGRAVVVVATTISVQAILVAVVNM
jgi:hypothetical protein